MSGEHLFNATGSGQDLRGGSFHEPGHFVVGAVPAADLDQPVSGPDIVAIRPGRHVAAEQDVSQQRVGWWELPTSAQLQGPGRAPACIFHSCGPLQTRLYGA